MPKDDKIYKAPTLQPVTVKAKKPDWAESLTDWQITQAKKFGITKHGKLSARGY